MLEQDFYSPIPFCFALGKGTPLTSATPMGVPFRKKKNGPLQIFDLQEAHVVTNL